MNQLRRGGVVFRWMEEMKLECRDGMVKWQDAEVEGDVVSISWFFPAWRRAAPSEARLHLDAHLQGPSKRYLGGPMWHSVGKVVGMA